MTVAAERLPDRSNIVLFLADDLGWADLGRYGSTFYETPNIDHLAKDGAKFTDAYAACPVCSPTRASLMTRQWPQRTGVTDVIGAEGPDKWNFNARKRKLLWMQNGGEAGIDLDDIRVIATTPRG